MDEIKLIIKTAILFRAIYYAFKEYSLEAAMQKVEADLMKLKSRIMGGDLKAARLALDQLEQYDKLKTEFEAVNFNI